MPAAVDIATHDEPAWRDRANFIKRLDLTQDDLPGRYEQVWAHQHEDNQLQLCCIPFFAYELSLGDTFAVADGSGAYRVIEKSGHRTIRYVIDDAAQAHQLHEDLHGALVQLGVDVEFYGHAHRYAAIDIATEDHADRVIKLLNRYASDTMHWEWADPTIP